MTVVAGLEPEMRALLDLDTPWSWDLPLDAFAAERMHPEDLKEIMEVLRVNTPWLTARQAAIYLGCSISRVRHLTMLHEIPHEKDGSRVLYNRDELDEFIRAGGKAL